MFKLLAISTLIAHSAQENEFRSELLSILKYAEKNLAKEKDVSCMRKLLEISDEDYDAAVAIDDDIVNSKDFRAKLKQPKKIEIFMELLITACEERERSSIERFLNGINVQPSYSTLICLKQTLHSLNTDTVLLHNFDNKNPQELDKDCDHLVKSICSDKKKLKLNELFEIFNVTSCDHLRSTEGACQYNIRKHLANGDFSIPIEDRVTEMQNLYRKAAEKSKLVAKCIGKVAVKA